MKVLVAHPGTQHSFQLVKQLYIRDMLFEFHTGIAFGKDSFIHKMASIFPSALYHKMSKRFIDDVPDKFIRRNVFNELKALIRIKTGQASENVFYKRNRQFQKNIPDKSLRVSDAVIGFDTSSWILSGRCNALLKKFFLDVSIAHPVSKDKIYDRIIQLYPAWKFSVKQKEQKYIAIEQKEIAQADHIVVASKFTLGTYIENGIPTQKISINPYGVDTDFFKPIEKKATGKIHFVFLGLIDARKGIPFLLEAWHAINDPNIELTLIGPVDTEIEKLINTRYPSVIIKGKLSFDEVRNSLPKYDVMIFPSFFEGYGLVIPEAMACGLPVISTTATCAPDIIENGKEGILIEPGNMQELKKAIGYFITQPGRLNEMSRLARKKAEQINWNTYGDQWSKIIHSN